MAEIKTHPEIKKLLRPLSVEERAELEARISVEGIRDPLCVCKLDGADWYVLDGHNRLEIAEARRLQFRTVEIRQVNSLDEAKEWIVRNQLARRNITPDDASYWRGKLYELEKKREGRPKKSPEKKLAHNEPVSAESKSKDENKPTSTAEKVAQKTGVAPATVKRDAQYTKAVDKIAEVAGPEAKTKLLSPQTPVRQKKDVIALARVAESKPDVVKSVIAGATSVSKALDKQKPFAPRSAPAVPRGQQVSQNYLRGVLRDAGAKALTSTSNLTDSSAHALIGKLIREQGTRIVTQAIAILIEEWPADGAAFLVGTVTYLKGLGNGRTNQKIVGYAAPKPGKYENRR